MKNFIGNIGKLYIVIQLTSLMFLAQGCTTVILPGETNATKWRIGITRINQKKSNNGAVANKLMTIGYWDDSDGYGIGYRSKNQLMVNLNCQVVILVKDEAELLRIKEFIKSEFKDGDNICTTVD